MPVKLVPHSIDMKDAVNNFNARMRAGGSPWGFYEDPNPDWIPKRDGAATWREYHLAVEDGEHVRGGMRSSLNSGSSMGKPNGLPTGRVLLPKH